MFIIKHSLFVVSVYIKDPSPLMSGKKYTVNLNYFGKYILSYIPLHPPTLEDYFND